MVYLWEREQERNFVGVSIILFLLGEGLCRGVYFGFGFEGSAFWGSWRSGFGNCLQVIFLLELDLLLCFCCACCLQRAVLGVAEEQERQFWVGVEWTERLARVVFLSEFEE